LFKPIKHYAFFDPDFNSLTLFDSSFMGASRQFAKEYEAHFGKEVIIRLDYS
jgi:hypothetical protein